MSGIAKVLLALALVLALSVAVIAVFMVSKDERVAASIVGSRYQAENMNLPASGASVNTSDTTDDGDHLRWTGSAGVANTASQSVSIPSGAQVDQVQLRARESGSGAGDDALAVYDGSTKLGTVKPNPGSTWDTLVLDLSSPLASGSHTIKVGPNQTNDAFVALDWFELYNAGGATPPPSDRDADGVPDASDNCPDTANPGQADDDGDGIGNACDTGNPPPPPSGNVGVGTAGTCNKIINPGAQTLASAASTSGGGTICLHKGVYGGLGVTNKISGSGTSSNRLVVKSYPGEQAQIRGQITFSNASYLTVRDLYIDGRYQPFSAAGGLTSSGNPDMSPALLMGGSHVIVTNNEFDGGSNDASVVSGSRPFDSRSTIIGYRDPNDDHFVGNWLHDVGVLAKYSADGKGAGHGMYLSNAHGTAPHEIADNVMWKVDGANAIDLHGMSVGPYSYDVSSNIVFASDRAVDFNNQNHDTNLHGNILLDNPEREIVRYDQGQGSNFIQDNCLDGPIQINNNASLTVRNNVTDNSASVSGTPKSSSWTINASSACMAKYNGTMYP